MSRCFLVTVALTLMISGCGPDTGGRVGVTGTVTFQGQPLDSGNIQFDAVDGSGMTGAAITDGKYSVPAETGVIPGEYTVRVSKAGDDAAAPKPVAGEAPGDPGAFSPREEMIPEEYNLQSKLTTQLTADKANVYDVDIP
ncbi:carboxypeptidase regulatory-like domain-containing protein [Rosistilla oblonga]|uniref:Carboxypeptidase regulatory-like domain-containing protein n=1 Tax=Rosistilla oblonga TaxID=2527990 RepID=A0A518J194_9BACT|nr:carboxypeptidase regulatory-like domain-containing protein [Rosistilla oblonga]QDV59109.1 hypothetical protein Mal33_51350 [Rosistilla oblonga]